MSQSPPITVAIEDRDRLLRVIEQNATEVAAQLEGELERALLMPASEVPHDVIVMNSELEYEDTQSGQRRRVRLVYPPDADADLGRISVLAPLGCALLGLQVGQAIDWHMPGGQRRLRVISVTHPTA